MATTMLSYASPMLPIVAGIRHMCPSTDGRVRTSRGSSDDSDVLRSDGWVDGDLRSGGPILACSPSVTDSFPLHLFHKIQPETNLSKGILKTLEEAGIIAYTFILCYRKCENFIHDDLVPTLLVDALKASPKDPWLSTSKALYALLQENNLSEFNVEICDGRLNQPRFPSPVQPTDPIYPLWDRILDEILRHIGPSHILTIECLRFGESLNPEQNPTTVILTVDRNSKDSWKLKREKIISILDKHGLKHVAVCIGQGEICRSIDTVNPKLPDTAWQSEMQVGLSMGIHRSTHSSFTFGGWVELQQSDGSEWMKLGITCFHNVLPHMGDLPVHDMIALRDAFAIGIAPESRLGRLLQVEQPSWKDSSSSIKALDEVLGWKPPEHIVSLEEIIKDGGELEPKHQERYDKFKKLRDDFHKAKSKMEYFHKLSSQSSSCSELHLSILPINPRHADAIRSESYAGHVHAGSGYRLFESDGKRRQADWALLQVPERRHSSNQLSAYGISIHFPLIQDELGPHKDPPTKGYTLYKLGGSTEITTGSYSGLDSLHLNIPNGRLGRHIVSTREHCVTGHPLFSLPGDSGAIVFDRDANAIGMIFAGNAHSKVSYFTKFSDLFGDIKTITGAVNVRIADRGF